MSDDEESDTPGILARAVDRVAGTQRKRARLRMAGALIAVVAVFVALAAVAWLGWGVLAAVLFVVGLVAGISGPPVAILTTRDLIPNIAAIGLAVAAQIAFGVAALVRREDGDYEWTVVREDSRGTFARVDGGRTVPIDATPGEFYRFGFGQLAVVEERGEQLERYRVVEPAGDSDEPIETRANVPVQPPRNEDGGILVSLAAIQRRVRGSASSTLVRRGRDKALDEEGGTGQLSQLWTMAFATVLLLVGFAMTAGVLML
jgi:hypothetical protein